MRVVVRARGWVLEWALEWALGWALRAPVQTPQVKVQRPRATAQTLLAPAQVL